MPGGVPTGDGCSSSRVSPTVCTWRSPRRASRLRHAGGQRKTSPADKVAGTDSRDQRPDWPFNRNITLLPLSVSWPTLAPSPIGTTLGVPVSTLAGTFTIGSTSTGGGRGSTPIAGGWPPLGGTSILMGGFFASSVLASSVL